jgi:hypothetical protein
MKKPLKCNPSKALTIRIKEGLLIVRGHKTRCNNLKDTKIISKIGAGTPKYFLYDWVIPCQTSKNKTIMSPWVENFKIDIFRGFYIQS